MAVFLAGAFADAAFRHVLLGEAAWQPACATGHGLAASGHGAFSTLVPAEGQVDGLVFDPDAATAARLTWLMAAIGQAPVAVRLAADPQGAVAYAGTADGPWLPAVWQERFAGTAIAAATDILALHGQADPAEIAARLGSVLVSASSRVRAVGGPTTLRHHAAPGDVAVARRRQPYARFFALDEYDTAWRRFDGGFSDSVTRAAFVSGDAVTVLPYDPARDRVLVIEQFRAGPLARGDAQAWQIEAIAGRIDPGETPEEAGRREAVEEADLRLDALIPVARYYPSPGAVSEYIYSYVALIDLPDGTAGVFGEADEAEDIRGHLIPFDRLMELVASGEVENAPLILTALWLQRERARLRAAG